MNKLVPAPRIVPPPPSHPLSHKPPCFPCPLLQSYQCSSVCCAAAGGANCVCRPALAAPLLIHRMPTLAPPPTQAPARATGRRLYHHTLPVCVGSFCTPPCPPVCAVSTSDPLPSLHPQPQACAHCKPRSPTPSLPLLSLFVSLPACALLLQNAPPLHFMRCSATACNTSPPSAVWAEMRLHEGRERSTVAGTRKLQVLTDPS